ncbi:MAG TPA: peptidoglycan DD-metalloendopeptidase family protein [Longimicrobiales bacterium]|nr:peptidoglycan DD-metalloendopeptidase family protein [Longimicrobiales bacterium]
MRIRLRVLALALLGVVAGGFAVVHPRPGPDPVTLAPVLAPQYAHPAEAVDAHVLARGETLSELLSRASVGGPDLSGLILAVREQVDPRRLLPNTSVLVRRWAETGSPRAVELALNADSTVRLRRNEVGWAGEMVLTPTVVDTLFLAGRLGEGGNIYRAVLEHPELDLPRRERESLVWQLANIYGWVLDFSHDMHPGDRFRVVYEREARPDGTSRASRVLVAEVVNREAALPAIFYDPQGDGGDYFNPEGKSLRLQFRRYPVAYPRITSNFNWRRYHPVLRRSRPHLGTDFGTGYGAPILATADGVVSFAAWDGGYGNLVKLEHGHGYETRYAHLSRFAKGVRRGRRVKQGETIGFSGATGLATAPHLHYEFRRFDQPVDARAARLPAAPPVPASRMAEFRRLAEERALLLALVPVPLPDDPPQPAN